MPAKPAPPNFSIFNPQFFSPLLYQYLPFGLFSNSHQQGAGDDSFQWSLFCLSMLNSCLRCSSKQFWYLLVWNGKTLFAKKKDCVLQNDNMEISFSQVVFVLVRTSSKTENINGNVKSLNLSLQDPQQCATYWEHCLEKGVNEKWPPRLSPFPGSQHNTGTKITTFVAEHKELNNFVFAMEGYVWLLSRFDVNGQCARKHCWIIESGCTNLTISDRSLF